MCDFIYLNIFMYVRLYLGWMCAQLWEGEKVRADMDAELQRLREEILRKDSALKGLETLPNNTGIYIYIHVS